MGREGDPSLDGEMVVRLHGLPCQFSAVVLAEARRCTGAIRTSDLQGRLDLRDVATITIDPEDAQDFDDAISLECIDGGYRLGVHIADVAHYVAEGSALDAEAMRRGTSVYLPGLCVPMLPHELSEHACSLRPHVDRLALSVLIDLDCDGAVRDAQMARSGVHSDARLTYAEALDACEGGSDALSSPLQEMLATMAAVARTLLARRDAAGAIDFDLPEAKVTFDDTGRVSAVTRSERTFAHRLIEQFMVLANEVVARYLTTAGLPMIYRIHERPDPDKVANFAAVALAYGHAFNTRAAEPAEFQRLLRRLAGRAEERMLSYLMLRTLRTARYATSNSGHFGLATDCYTHFTSPIRRYPDLVVHRLLRAALDATPSPPNPSGAVKLEGRVFDPAARSRVRERLDHVAALASDRERAADDAASEAVAWKRAELLSSMLGDECDAVITRLFPYGLLVELADVYAEGFLAVEALGNEEFRLTEVGDALIGRSTRTAFRLGDQLHVRIDRVDRRQQWFDASLV
jgi:ribonuclease R